MKYLVLYNPLAGEGHGKERSEKLNEILKGDLLVFRDMTQIYGEYKEVIGDNPEISLVICGGDGTLNRFVNDTRNLKIENDIYYFPIGCGNDFGTDIGMKFMDKPKIINQYLKNLPRAIVNEKEYLFLNNVGFGIDGYCCRVADEMIEQGVIGINYSKIAVKGFLKEFKPRNAKLWVNGKEHSFKSVWTLPTMNGRFYGGGMMSAPYQNRLNPQHTVSTLVCHGWGRFRVLLIFPSIFKGRHLKHTSLFRLFEGNDITVEFETPCELQIDGETILDVKKYTVASALAEPVVRRQ